MAKRKKVERQTYDYECSLTGESYTYFKKAANPTELISVKGYYELHPEKDDRPEAVKLRLEQESKAQESAQSEFDELAALAETKD